MIQEHEFECDSCYMVFNRIDMIPTDGGNFCEECYDDLWLDNIFFVVAVENPYKPTI